MRWSPLDISNNDSQMAADELIAQAAVRQRARNRSQGTLQHGVARVPFNGIETVRIIVRLRTVSATAPLTGLNNSGLRPRLPIIVF